MTRKLLPPEPYSTALIARIKNSIERDGRLLKSALRWVEARQLLAGAGSSRGVWVDYLRCRHGLWRCVGEELAYRAARRFGRTETNGTRATWRVSADQMRRIRAWISDRHDYYCSASLPSLGGDEPDTTVLFCKYSDTVHFEVDRSARRLSYRDAVSAPPVAGPVRAVPKNKPCQLYRWFDKTGTLLYVGISVSTLARVAQHRAGSEWYKHASSMTVETYPSKDAAACAEINAIRRERPAWNKAHAT